MDTMGKCSGYLGACMIRKLVLQGLMQKGLTHKCSSLHIPFLDISSTNAEFAFVI